MVLDGFLTVTPDNGVPNVDGEIINNTCTQNDSTSGRIVSYVFQTSPVSTVNNGTECDATIDIDLDGASIPTAEVSIPTRFMDQNNINIPYVDGLDIEVEVNGVALRLSTDASDYSRTFTHSCTSSEIKQMLLNDSTMLLVRIRVYFNATTLSTDTNYTSCIVDPSANILYTKRDGTAPFVMIDELESFRVPVGNGSDSRSALKTILAQWQQWIKFEIGGEVVIRVS